MQILAMPHHRYTHHRRTTVEVKLCISSRKCVIVKGERWLCRVHAHEEH